VHNLVPDPLHFSIYLLLKRNALGVIVKLCGMGIREVEKGRKKAYPDF